MSWQESARKLWGNEFIASMAEALRLNRRTIERWRAGKGAPKAAIQAELERLACHPHARHIGAILRRMANGESLTDIAHDIERYRIAVGFVRQQAGNYKILSALAAGD